jgi:hypothetical protein
MLNRDNFNVLFGNQCIKVCHSFVNFTEIFSGMQMRGKCVAKKSVTFGNITNYYMPIL